MKKILIILATFLVISSAVFGIYSLVKYLRTDVLLSTEKKSYLHWEFIKIQVKIRNKQLAEAYKTQPFYVSVFKDKERIITIGGLGKLPLTYNSKKKLWEGNWPCPWNATEGQYRTEPFITQNIRFTSRNFLIKHRKLRQCFPDGFGVLTFENATTLSKIKIVNPEGKEVGWRGFFDWTDFIGANAFWYLAGQSDAESANADEQFPWIERNISKLPEMGKEAHSRGLKFGAYIISYLTFGHYKYKNYRYAYEFNTRKGGPVETRAISIDDEKRIADLIKLIKVFNNIPEIDYIGLDYIRNALGGYELVDEFVQEMNVKVPAGWEKFSSAKRMGWLANEKVSRRNMGLIDQWQWWRAHKVSKIINRITTEVKLKKPLWLFTLTWEKGWQHGQDPIMFADAGADIDSLMLYEATRSQFNMLLDDWHNYVKKGEANLVLGDVVDEPLHQNTLNPPGPEEFYNRLIEATKKIYNNGTSNGIFIHDLARALWGRIKPYSPKEWLLAGGAAITEMRRLNGVLPMTAELDLNTKLRTKQEFVIPVIVKNISSGKKKNIVIKVYLIGGEILGGDRKILPALSSEQTQAVNFRGIIKSPAWEKNLKNMVAVQLNSGGRNMTFFKYVTAR